MKNNKKGFTIVELIFVISCIIAIISFLAPKFIGYMNKVNRFKAITIASQIEDAIVSANPDEISDSNKIKSVLSEFTNVNIVSANIGSDNIINIEYKYDNNVYDVNINIANLGYQVKKGEVEVFKTDSFITPSSALNP